MAKINFAKWVYNRLASLVSYDNSTTDITEDNVQDSISQLANRHFGKRYVFAEVASFSTSSAAYVSALTATIPGAPNGVYRCGWSYTQTNSKSNTNGTTRVIHDGTDVYHDFTQVGQSENSINGFYGNITHGHNGDLTIDLELKRDSGNGLSQVSLIKLEVWRIS